MGKLSLLFLAFVGMVWSCSSPDSGSQASQDKQEPVVAEQVNSNSQTPKPTIETAVEELSASTDTGATLVKTSEEILSQLPEGLEAPRDMVFVPGGVVEMGSLDGLPRERPIQVRKIQSFFMDKTEVTVGQWRKFVKATGHRTESEKFGDSAVFDKTQKTWILKPGAYWEFPLGPDQPKAKDNHPVTHVSYNDALAFAEWAGKRIPTEAEWEHAARNASNDRQQYSWGAELVVDGTYKANTWQGYFPEVHYVEDGFEYTSPTGTFGETPLGLVDMAGNVWEWTQDWYFGQHGIDATNFRPTKESERVIRGGSFMCDPSYCHGYRVSGRSGTTPETGLFHVGFRLVKDLPLLN
ncbi:MAG: formylglycine-generating enzyme family protein [Bacteroidota bacterium]